MLKVTQVKDFIAFGLFLFVFWSPKDSLRHFHVGLTPQNLCSSRLYFIYHLTVCGTPLHDGSLTIL